jgi:hypothetical protein
LGRFKDLSIHRDRQREATLFYTIDLVLIDQQSVGKRSPHLMDTVNAKKRWTTIYWRVNKFLKESHIVTGLLKERGSFLKINDINDISFLGTPDCHHYCAIAYAGMLILCLILCYNKLRISNKYGSLTRNKLLMKSVTTLK